MLLVRNMIYIVPGSTFCSTNVGRFKSSSKLVQHKMGTWVALFSILNAVPNAMELLGYEKDEPSPPGPLQDEPDEAYTLFGDEPDAPAKLAVLSVCSFCNQRKMNRIQSVLALVFFKTNRMRLMIAMVKNQLIQNATQRRAANPLLVYLSRPFHLSWIHSLPKRQLPVQPMSQLPRSGPMIIQGVRPRQSFVSKASSPHHMCSVAIVQPFGFTNTWDFLFLELQERQLVSEITN